MQNKPTNPKKKKAKKTFFLILVLLIVLVAAAYFLYSTFFKSPNSTEIATSCMLDDTLFTSPEINEADRLLFEKTIDIHIKNVQGIKEIEAFENGDTVFLKKIKFSNESHYEASEKMIENDILLLKLILEADTSLIPLSDKQAWLKRYDALNEEQVQKVYHILIRDKKQFLLENTKIANNLLDSLTFVFENNFQYNYLYKINKKVNNKRLLFKFSLLDNRFDEALTYVRQDLKAFEADSDSSEYYALKYHEALALMLTSQYKEAYSQYVYLLNLLKKEPHTHDTFNESIGYINHFIKYSNYAFDRTFANLILGLHYYYGRSFTENPKEAQDYMNCFLLSYNKKDDALKDIADEVEKLYSEKK